MSTTLVGLFDDYGQAQEACRKLRAAGVDKQSIRLNGDGEASEPPPAPTAVRRGRNQEPGAIRRFFSQLFGSDDETGASNYAEAVRRGSAVVTVAVADAGLIDEVKHTLNECGAVDVDDRAQPWKAIDPVAPTLPMEYGTDDGEPQDDSRKLRLAAYDDLRAPSWTGQNGGAQHRRTTTARERGDEAKPLASLAYAAPGKRATPQFGDDAPQLGRMAASHANGYAGRERRRRNDPRYLGSERRWAD